MTARLLTSIMLIQPLLVPEIIWSPEAVKMVTVVVCFASSLACFSASASSPSVLDRFGAVGRECRTSTSSVMSTRRGCASKSDATKRCLYTVRRDKNHAVVGYSRVEGVEFSNVCWRAKPHLAISLAILEVPKNDLPSLAC